MLKIKTKLKCLNKCFAASSNIVVRKRHVWKANGIVQSPFKDVDIPEMNLVDYIWMNLDKWATKTATVCGITNRSYTYEQIYKQTRTFGANLRKKFGIRDGDVIAFMSHNSPEYPIAVLGAQTAGAVVTTINPVYTSYEVHRHLQLSEAKIIITIPSNIGVVKESLKALQKNVPIVTIHPNEQLPEGTISFKELAEDVHVDFSILKDVKRSFEDVCFLPYSSGTTGLPKGVELMNKNIIANSQQQNCPELKNFADTTGSNQDSLIVVLPMFHSYAASMLMFHKLSVGLKLVTVPKFQPQTFLDTLIKYKINILYVAPPMVLFMANHEDAKKKHLDSVTSMISGAAPLTHADILKLFDKAQRSINFTQAYGLTESSPLATACPPGYKDYSTVGFAVPNVELKIVDNDLKTLGVGEFGELLIKGPNVMKGYKNNPEASQSTFLDDEAGRWLKSGDIAKIDETGAVTVVDRLKELIKVKGFQVPPAELENVVKEHPSVLDVAVIGIPDEKLGEIPKAYVVLKDTCKVSEEEIMNFVSEKVAPYKKIHIVEFIDSVPKNPSGKILRRELKKLNQ